MAGAYQCSITIPVQVTVSGDTAPQEKLYIYYEDGNRRRADADGEHAYRDRIGYGQLCPDHLHGAGRLHLPDHRRQRTQQKG